MYSENAKTVTVSEMQKFFIQEQKDLLGNDERKVSEFICDFLKVIFNMYTCTFQKIYMCFIAISA